MVGSGHNKETKMSQLQAILVVIIHAIGLFGLIWVLTWLAVEHLSTPVVYMSYPDSQCVEVMYAPEHSCANLPEKYTIEWVSPR
jgi:hypothetical protein